MKKIFYIVISLMLFAVACEDSNTDNDVPTGSDWALDYTVEQIAGHEAVIVKPEDIESGAPVVVVLAENLELRSLAAKKPDVNFKAAEHCLIGRYILCIVEVEKRADIAFLTDVKALFPDASKFYLLSYCNGLSYTAAMQMPDEFAAYACVSGAIDVETYKVSSFQKPVSFVHVHATENPIYKWTGVEGVSVSVPLSVAAVASINECVTFKTSELLHREGKGRVTCTKYVGGDSNCEVHLYSVESANSGWCDEEFEVYNQVWNFFKVR